MLQHSVTHRSLCAVRPSLSKPLHSRPVVLSRAGVSAPDPSTPSLQLGTAQLPRNLKVEPFISSLFQWASTLTQSGANYPFALPLAMDRVGNDGFKIALLKRTTPGVGGAFDAAASIVTTVETIDERKVLMIRLYEGPAGQADRRTPAAENDRERLETLLQTLVDVPIIMQTMPSAITAAIRSST